MTNEQLLQEFRNQLMHNQNCFDIYTNISETSFVKAYQETPYYKATGHSTFEAYETFLRNGGKIDNIIQAITNMDFQAIAMMAEGLKGSFNLDGVISGLDDKHKSLLEEYMPFLEQIIGN